MSGAEIFAREWMPDDPRSHGGDGLGPVFNDTSCIACHNQGGVGGGGPNSKNVNIITASAMMTPDQLAQQTEQRPPDTPFIGRLIRQITGGRFVVERRATPQDSRDEAAAQLLEERTNLHPGFATADSVVLHHFGTEKRYDGWKQSLLGMGGGQTMFQQSGMMGFQQSGMMVGGFG
ncbi:MAG: di-heme oxidoredictase family protein, partial [Planctomycetaceae bacterium]